MQYPFETAPAPMTDYSKYGSFLTEAVPTAIPRSSWRQLRTVQGGASLHGEILARLRDHIVAGSLTEGARIPERQVCEMFGISRTPLREALKVLASEGLVDLLPNRGARVRALSEKDIRDLFDLLAGLKHWPGGSRARLSRRRKSLK